MAAGFEIPDLGLFLPTGLLSINRSKSLQVSIHKNTYGLLTGTFGQGCLTASDHGFRVAFCSQGNSTIKPKEIVDLYDKTREY